MNYILTFKQTGLFAKPHEEFVAELDLEGPAWLPGHKLSLPNDSRKYEVISCVAHLPADVIEMPTSVH